MTGAEKPGQAAAHLLVVIEVEVLTHELDENTWPALFQRFPERVLLAAHPLKAQEAA